MQTAWARAEWTIRRHWNPEAVGGVYVRGLLWCEGEGMPVYRCCNSPGSRRTFKIVFVSRAVAK
jgi:hypothetical protein